MRKSLENLLNRVAKEMDCPQMDEVAAFLLANGVIVPPVKIGQTVYSALTYDDEEDTIEEYTVDGLGYIDGEWFVWCEKDTDWYKLGTEYCQLTREDAEKVLAERGKKRPRKITRRSRPLRFLPRSASNAASNGISAAIRHSRERAISAPIARVKANQNKKEYIKNDDF